MSMIKSVLITGANAGLGKESARQLALEPNIEKIYLGVRDEEKGNIAKQELEVTTGKEIFDVLRMDVSDYNSLRSAVEYLEAPVDALLMNAGGVINESSSTLNKKAMDIFSVNLIGHVVLVEELLKAKKLTQTAVYAGSEAARGVPKMRIKCPKPQAFTVEEFDSMIRGEWFGLNADPMYVYAYVKYLAALWMSDMAKKHSNVRFVTISPGSTGGTQGAKDLPLPMKIMFKYVGPALLPLFGLMHSLEKGARRYVDVLFNESYKSGHFYASKASTTTSPTVDQSTILADFANEAYQQNASEAVYRHVT